MPDQYNNFSIKEVVTSIDNKVDNLTNTIGRLLPEIEANTEFRKKAINAIVGFTFLCLAGLGLAILKATGIVKL